jgi:outer membrane protein assembly factor BamB
VVPTRCWYRNGDHLRRQAQFELSVGYPDSAEPYEMRKSLFFIVTGWAVLIPPSYAQQPFVPALQGCAMAHCDSRMSGLIRMNPPTGAGAAVQHHDALSAGKGIGLGCSSNGTLIACTYKDPAGNNLVAYNASGKRLWASGSLLNANAYASAPLISAAGDIIAADDQRILRFNRGGSVIWSSTNPSGIPISPVLTGSGTLIVATKGGPVSAFDSTDGHLLGSLVLRVSPDSPDLYETINTPCARGNRIYISAQSQNSRSNGSLIAVDVQADNSAAPLSIAWQFPFGGPSGASPTCLANMVYFDGMSLTPGGPANPTIFGLRDDGPSATLLWAQTVPNPLPAAMAQDPRGGVWSMYVNYPSIERRDAGTGALLESLNVDALIGDAVANNPFSAIMIAGPKSRPIMILGTTSAYVNWNTSVSAGTTRYSSYVVAIDLAAGTALWKVNLSPSLGSDSASSQFAIAVDATRNPTLVFAGNKSGAYFVAAP